MKLLSTSNKKTEEKEPKINPIKTVTLTGLYGSGKSTLTTQIIENSDKQNVFVGSETADIGMDGGSIPLPEEYKIELQNVCMACNTDGEFDKAIEDILGTLEESDRIMVEGPGNAGTRDLAGTVSSLPELDQKYVGRVINLENWEGEKAELKEEDLKTANFIAVNRTNIENNKETVEEYLEQKNISTPVFEYSLEDPITMEELEQVEEWSTEDLVQSMGPSHLTMMTGMEETGHKHRDTEYGRLEAGKSLEEINKALLQIEEEEFEDLRVKINAGDYFVNVVNGNIQVEDYEEDIAPGYFIASNFGTVPQNIQDAFKEIESLTSTSIAPGASKKSIKQNLEYKLEQAQNTEIQQDLSGLPDIHSSAIKVAEEAKQTWEDDEIEETYNQIAEEYANSAVELIEANSESYNPLIGATLAAELHWISNKAQVSNENAQEMAYDQVATGLARMDESHIEELNSYSDSEDFHEYFSAILEEGLEKGEISHQEYDNAVTNLQNHLEDLNEYTEFCDFEEKVLI